MRQVQLFASIILGLLTASILFMFRSSNPGFTFLYPMLMARKPVEVVRPVEEVVDAPRQFKNLEQVKSVDLMSGKWLIFVYAPWCPHSQRYWPVWQGQVHEAKEAFERGDDISVATVNFDRDPELAAWLGVTALPSVVHLQDGHGRREPSTLSIWQLRVFSAFGGAFVGPQARSLEWLKEHRRGFYSVAAAVVGLGLAGSSQFQ